jgi:predicted permease
MNWLRRLLHKSRSEGQLDKELRFHLEQQIADNLAAGCSPEEAGRRAQQEFGGIERVKEEVRDTRWETHLENLVRDFRYALRTLHRDRRFSLIAIFALALGIAASTVVFSVVYNVFFHALPYKNYDRSVVVSMDKPGSIGRERTRQYFYPEELRAFREQNHVFEEIIVHARMRPTYDDGKSIRFFAFGATVSSNTFDYLGVPPLLGRTLTLEDGNLGAPPVFVINYRFWQREFGGDPKIVGRVFVLEGRPTTLVGIMPSRFDAFGANFWLPVSPDKAYGAVLGRLKSGVSVRTAEAEFDAIAHRMHKPNPAGVFPEDNFEIRAETLSDSLIGTFKKTLYILLAAVLLLLLIACSNVANLLLVRATVREREMAMRATLGATRGRLFLQLLVESFILALTASVAGWVLAYFGLKVVVSLIPAGTLPEETVIRMNAPILFLSLGLSILTTILCSLAPALHVVSGDVQLRLAGTGKGVGGASDTGRFALLWWSVKLRFPSSS